MKSAPFESTPEFAHFKSVMSKLIRVPKDELDALVQASKDSSPRKSNPDSPGRKPNKRRRPARKI